MVKKAKQLVKQATKKKTGRPPKANKGEIQEAVCRLTMSTSWSLSNILAELSQSIEGVPVRSTIMLWLAENKEFSDKYARAKRLQCEIYADEIIEIADDNRLDVAFTEEGKPFIDKEHINRSRLRVDTRKFVLSKLLPDKYGDKASLAVNADVGLTINLIDKFEVKK